MMFLKSDLPITLPPQVNQQLKQPISTFEVYVLKGKALLALYGPRLIFAVLLLLFGLWAIRIVMRALNRLMVLRDIDPTLRPFLKSLISISLKVLLFLSVISQIGFHTTSFVAAIGAAGLAIGLALQGSLSNLAGGILILIFKPFKVGDYIATQKQEGTVHEILILYTVLWTTDNKKVVIPNGVLSNNEVVNYSSNELRRVDLKINIGLGSNLLSAKQIIEAAIQGNELILKDPAYTIGISELTDNSVGIVCWIWVKRENYFQAKHYMYEHIKLAFDQAGIYMPTQELQQAIARK